jgi:DNA-binding CsgD family transcriptional regulator
MPSVTGRLPTTRTPGPCRSGRHVRPIGRSGRVAAFPELTDRELEVLDLVARGRSNGDIARRLHLSEKTVGNNVSSILTKFGGSTGAEAIARARGRGWVMVPDPSPGSGHSATARQAVRPTGQETPVPPMPQ